MAGYQLLTLVGNVGKEDPEMRYTPSGKAVTNFSMAVGKTFTNAKGEKVTETQWFGVSVWGSAAEACHNYLKHGNRVMITGELRPIRKYTDSSGVEKYVTNHEVTASQVVFLENKNTGEKSESNGGYDAPPTVADDSDIPF